MKLSEFLCVYTLPLQPPNKNNISIPAESSLNPQSQIHDTILILLNVD